MTAKVLYRRRRGLCRRPHRRGRPRGRGAGAALTGPRFLMFETLAERTLALSQVERRRDPRAAITRRSTASSGRCSRAACATRSGSSAISAPPIRAARPSAFWRWRKRRNFRSRVIAIVEGDDLSGSLSKAELAARETGGAMLQGDREIIAANLYLGAAADRAGARCQGADIVVTGRVTDSALALGPLMHAFRLEGRGLASPRRRNARRASPRMRQPDHRRLFRRSALQGSCRTWRRSAIRSPKSIPMAAIVITKPAGTGGRIDRQTVIEQTAV